MRLPPDEPNRGMDPTRLSDIRIVDTLEAAHDSALGDSILEPPRAAGEIGWFQHYRVLRRLGQGGMGIVFLAEDVHLRRQVALKVMHQCLVSESAARRRFLREARAMLAADNVTVKVAARVPVLPSVTVTSLIFSDGGGGIQSPVFSSTNKGPP
jgi:serine/threonine protein kinase